MPVKYLPKTDSKERCGAVAFRDAVHGRCPTQFRFGFRVIDSIAVLKNKTFILIISEIIDH